MSWDWKKEWPEDAENCRYLVGAAISINSDGLVSFKYVVFIDNDFDLDWNKDEIVKGEEKETFCKERFNEVQNKISEAECIPNDHHPDRVRINFKRMLGEAKIFSFLENYDEAEKMIEKAVEYINERNNVFSRFWYLSTVFISSLIWGIATTMIYYGDFFKKGNMHLFLISFFVGGSASFLWVFLRMGKEEYMPGASKKVFILEGVSKVFASSICAVTAALLVHQRLLFGSLVNEENVAYIMVLASIIGGVCERWIPSIISKQVNKGGA